MASRTSYGPPRDRRYEADVQPHTRPRHDSRSSAYKPETRTYDPRYSYPSRPPRSPASSKPRWPPQPSVEEERIALLKEHASHGQTNTEDVSSRGTIDQEPIILDVKHPKNTDDLRFVWLGPDRDHKAATFTPPSSDDEKKARGRRKAPKLDTTGLPEMARTSSPYSYTKPTPLSHQRSSGEYLLSPDSLTPPSTASSLPLRRPPTSAPTPLPTDGQRQASAYARKDRSPGSKDSSNVSHVFEEDDLEMPPAFDPASQRRSTRYSFTKQDTSSGTYRAVKQPPIQGNPQLAQRPHLGEDSRRYTESSLGTARPQFTESFRKPHPSKVTSLMQEAATNPSYPPPTRSSGRHPSSHESVSNSPHTSSHYPPSPPRSPRASSDRSRDNTPINKATSIRESREGSSDTSPQGSPHMVNPLPSTDSGWSSAFASNAARRSRPPSRLASSTTNQEQAARPPAQASSPARPSVSLPYPVDNHLYQLMPEEKDHQYFPDSGPLLDHLGGSTKPAPRSVTPSDTLPPRSRPSLPTRHSIAEGVPVSPVSPQASRQASFVAPSRSAHVRAPVAANTRPLPPCPRHEYVSGHDDWYVLDDCPGFDICPDCLEGVFANTIHRVYFRRAPRRPLSAEIRCDFSDPWMRLAWLLTLQRQLPTLHLLKALATHGLVDDQPCPDKNEAVRNWYTIRDESGRHLRNFTVCASDVRKIELLLPGFRGLFVPLPLRASYGYSNDDMRRICALRTTGNNRFALILDNLISTHETAAAAYRTPDPSSSIALIKHKLSLRQCTRDDMLRKESWHYIPSTPFFTVCPDCYHDVVEPAVYADSDVAMRLNATPAPVPNEGRLGNSCQLYSPRMRRVWRHAVEDNDLKYLIRKAKERKEVEEALQERVVEVRRKARRLEESEDTREVEEAGARLQRTLDETVEEWILWE